MKSNPYQSPKKIPSLKSRSSINTVGQEGSADPLRWLLGMAALTLLLAWIDALQEGVPGMVFILQVTFGAALAQLPGLACGELHRRRKTRNTSIFLFGAFCVAVASVSVYVLYVFTGQVQTIDNAAQMHVIIIPILLMMLAFFVYSIAGVTAGILTVVQGRVGRNN